MVHPGELNRRVELFKYTLAETSTGERQRVETSLGKRWAKRVDAVGSTEVEGKVLPLYPVSFVFRFEADLMQNGHSYFVRDVDGDFDVQVPRVVAAGRNSHVELTCTRRG